MPTLSEIGQAFGAYAGYQEEPPGSNRTLFGKWYGIDPAPWCAMFVSKVLFEKFGYAPCPASTSKGFAYTPAGAAYFQKHGKWSRTPKAGALVFFHWPSMGRIAHVGWVKELKPDGSFLSWEGNTDVRGGRSGGKVLLQHRSLSSIGAKGGFGYIDYESEPPSASTPTPAKKDDKSRPYPGGLGYSRKFYEGKTDGNVKWIQQKLNKTNLKNKLKEDGDFGKATEAAVKGFQGAMKLKQDGVVGPVTWKKLQAF